MGLSTSVTGYSSNHAQADPTKGAERRPRLSELVAIDKLSSIARLQLGNGISANLPRIQLYEATVTRTSDGRCVVDYLPSRKAPRERHSFPSDEMMEEWVISSLPDGAWKQIDRRSDHPTTSYLYADSELTEFDSYKEMILHLSEKHGKLLRVDDVTHGTTEHIEVKRSWLWGSYLQECPVDELINYADQIEYLGPVNPTWKAKPLEPAFSPVTQKVEALALSLMMLPLGPIASALAGGIGLLSGTVGQGPVATGSIPDQMVNPGEAFNLNFFRSDLFDSGSELITLEATLTDGSPLPAWLTYTGPISVRRGNYTATSTGSGIDVDAEYIYVGNDLGTAQVLNRTDLTNITMVSEISVAGDPFTDLVVRNGWGDAALGFSDYQLINFTTPSFPSLAGSFSTGFVHRLDVAGELVFLGENTIGMTILNRSDPFNIQSIGSFPTSVSRYVNVRGEVAFVDTSPTNPQHLNISDPISPTSLYLGPTLSAFTAQSVRGDFIFYGVGQSFQIRAVSDPTNSIVVGSRDSAPGTLHNTIVVSGNYGFSGTNNQQVEVTDLRNISNPPLVETINTGTANVASEGLAVFGNFLFSSTPAGLFVDELHPSGQFSGTPQLPDRDTLSVAVTASNSVGNATVSFNIVVFNGNPTIVGPTILNQTVNAESNFLLPVNPSRYSDPENDSLAITANSNGNPLPGWLTFDSNLLFGTPTLADIASFPVNLSANDPFGGSVAEQFTIEVLGPTGTSGSGPMGTTGSGPTGESLSSSEATTQGSSASSSAAGAAAGGAVGGCVCLVVTIGGVTYLIRMRKKPEEERAFELTARNERLLGGQFALSEELSDQERKDIFQQTKRYLKKGDPFIAGGAFGKIYAVRDTQKSRTSKMSHPWRAAKIVSGKDACQQSEAEAQFQRDYAGPGILPILHTIPNPSQDELIHIMPLVAYDGRALKHLIWKMQSVNGEVAGKVLLSFARDILTGLKTLHCDKPVEGSHLDLSDKNVVIDGDGNATIIDVGCSKRQRDFSGDLQGNARYFSVERFKARIRKVRNLEHKSIRYNGEEADGFALGLMLLEMYLGKDLSTILNYPLKSAEFFTLPEDHLEMQLAGIEFLKGDYQKGSIEWVIQGLLDTKHAIGVETALKAQCFKDAPSGKEKKRLFANLRPDPIFETATQGAYLDVEGSTGGGFSSVAASAQPVLRTVAEGSSEGGFSSVSAFSALPTLAVAKEGGAHGFGQPAYQNPRGADSANANSSSPPKPNEEQVYDKLSPHQVESFFREQEDASGEFYSTSSAQPTYTPQNPEPAYGEGRN